MVSQYKRRSYASSYGGSPDRLSMLPDFVPVMPSPTTFTAQLTTKRLVVVTGKGGVGKSTLSAVLGLLLAGQGKRVLVLEIDPRENVHRLFGLPPSGGEIVAAGSRLWLQNLKPRQVLDDIIRERVSMGPIARRVLESPVYQQLAAGMPGLRELAVLRYAFRATDPSVQERAREAFDLVVLDSPATGHGLALLRAPRLTADVIEAGPIGREAEALAALVEDPARTAVVLVTLAEEMPVDEVLELADALERERGRGPDGLFVNGLYPPFPKRLGSVGEEPTLRLWRERRAMQERELARLAARWHRPRIDLPLLRLPSGAELLRGLVQAIAVAVEGT